MMIASLAAAVVKIPFSVAASSGVSFMKQNILFDYTLLDIIGYLGVAAYFVLLTYFSGSTLGKMLFRLEVVSDKEWTFVNILYRETVGRFLSSLLCIGYFAIIVTAKKQGFHDMLCDTYVVYKNMYVKPRRPVNMATGQTTVAAPVAPKPVEPVAMQSEIDVVMPQQNEDGLAQQADVESEPVQEQQETMTLESEVVVTENEAVSQETGVPESEQVAPVQQTTEQTGYHYYDV